jgi:ABC-type transport system involved in multi-copper enzyme maturation permease subunit
MLRATRLVALESFVLLRRDRIFVPAIVVAAAVAGFAELASSWSIDNLEKVLYDVGLFGFQVTGCLVAALWGTKAISDSHQEGSLEVQLAAPISRTAWLLGKYLGLCCALALFGVILTLLWRGMLFVIGWGHFGRVQLAAFLAMGLGWTVVAALAMLFATCTRQALALFATICAWVAGLATAPVASALGSETAEPTRRIVEGLARYWDLGQLNLADHALDPGLLPTQELVDRAMYGGVLILILISVACIIFNRRDLV